MRCASHCSEDSRIQPGPLISEHNGRGWGGVLGKGKLDDNTGGTPADNHEASGTVLRLVARTGVYPQGRKVGRLYRAT
jgi:hypothetical protein